VSALTSYLGGLAGWNTIPGSDVVIVGATFRSNFSAVYTARQALLDKVAAVLGASAANVVATWTSSSGARANWINASSVVIPWVMGDSSAARTPWAAVAGDGRPADGATVGGTFGINISGQAQTSDIAPEAATTAMSTTAGTGSLVCNANTVTQDLLTLTYQNTSASSQIVQFEASWVGAVMSYNGSMPTVYKYYWSYTVSAGGGAASATMIDRVFDGSISNMKVNASDIQQISVPAGLSVTVVMSKSITHSVQASLIHDAASLRLTAIKR